MPPCGVPGALRKRPAVGSLLPFCFTNNGPDPRWAFWLRPRPSRPRRRLRPAWTRLRAPRPSERHPGTPAPSRRSVPPRPLLPGVAEIKRDLHLKPAPRFAPSRWSQWCAVGTQSFLCAGAVLNQRCHYFIRGAGGRGCGRSGAPRRPAPGAADGAPGRGGHWPGAGRFLCGPPWGRPAKSPFQG